MFERFKSNPTFEAMLTFTGWRGGFSQADKDALARSLDTSYRGEVRAKLFNLGAEPFTVNPGDRICKMVIVPYSRAKFWTVDELSESDRGTDGYGSTGI